MLIRQKQIIESQHAGKDCCEKTTHDKTESAKTTKLVFEKSELRQKILGKLGLFPMRAHSSYIQEEGSMFAGL